MEAASWSLWRVAGWLEAAGWWQSQAAAVAGWWQSRAVAEVAGWLLLREGEAGW